MAPRGRETAPRVKFPMNPTRPKEDKGKSRLEIKGLFLMAQYLSWWTPAARCSHGCFQDPLSRGSALSFLCHLPGRTQRVGPSDDRHLTNYITGTEGRRKWSYSPPLTPDWQSHHGTRGSAAVNTALMCNRPLYAKHYQGSGNTGWKISFNQHFTPPEFLPHNLCALNLLQWPLCKEARTLYPA